ncbi:F-box/WD repeat-containing protein 9-like isoform X2 [Temnothorax curvispinosus]|uniref:F-box/WD repeat-containing protein 9-like isoform X2 n=1 Tax=Temnothorax curvispinosus TaxID=300111 RepID=A0A6J1QXH7_9HYME|nr:F-box/WD repeat-containing protein 9-like isoform X2 [Temnothorax curvispinosus]
MTRMQAAPTTTRNMHNCHCCISRWSEAQQTVLEVVMRCDRETNSAVETVGLYGEIDADEFPCKSCVVDARSNEEPFYEVRDYLDNVPSDCLMAIDHTVYVCSYNNIIKSWVLTNTGLVHDRTYEIEQSNRIRDSLMCVSSCPEQALFATGSNHGTINVFDSRSSNKPIRQYRPSYSRYVDKLTMNTKYILSASEDETVTVSVWDQRADRIVKSITIPGERGEYPTCMSMRRDWVCVGNTKKLHMLDLTNDFELVKSYSTEHTETLTGVRLTHGCLITSSYDGTVRISSPTDPPKHIATLCPKIGAIDSMDYLNDTLAIAGGSLVVWRPRNQRV